MPLKFASVFIDQKEDRKPTVLILSETKVATDKWVSEFDMMRADSKWNGAVFFFDKEGAVYRSDVHMKGRQSSVSGYWEITLDHPGSKDLTGSAKTSEAGGTDKKLDATFHAALK